MDIPIDEAIDMFLAPSGTKGRKSVTVAPNQAKTASSQKKSLLFESSSTKAAKRPNSEVVGRGTWGRM